MAVLRTTASAAALLLLALLTTGAGKAEVRPGTAEGAELVKTGWWWQGNETPLDETAIAPPQPAPPNVPEGALPVSAAMGEPERYAALEFRLDAKPGEYAEDAVLVLRENTDPGATVNAEGAKVLACPVTESFWADGAAASWKARPAYDCELAGAVGERDAESGLWTFDLTTVASLWTAEGHTGSTSVAIVEGAEAPESFHVAFDGPARDGVGYRFVVGKAPKATALPEAAVAPPSAGGAGGPAPATGGTGSGSLFPASGDGGSAAAPIAGTAEVPPLAEAPAPAIAETAETADAATAPATADAVPVAAPAVVPAWYSGIPAAGYLLLPLVLGLGYLLMLALGPDAQPATGPAQHGVSRALERLRTAGVALTSKGQN
jgi:hypothetical protein